VYLPALVVAIATTNLLALLRGLAFSSQEPVAAADRSMSYASTNPPSVRWSSFAVTGSHSTDGIGFA